MFYLLDKPAQLSSHQALQLLAKKLGTTKIGHAGTLDPFATGLLLVATNEDTPLLAYADRALKTYDVTCELGAISSTQDVTGELQVTNALIPSDVVVEQAILALVKETVQTPPQFSAKQVDGVRAYTYARRGLNVDLQPISVHVAQVTHVKKLAPTTWSFTIEVSRGTYVRALVEQLGQILGCGAYTSALRRTHIGELTLPLATQEGALIFAPLAPLAVINLPPLKLEDYQHLMTGRVAPTPLASGEYALVSNDDVVGIAQVALGLIKVKRLLGKKLLALELDAR